MPKGGGGCTLENGKVCSKAGEMRIYRFKPLKNLSRKSETKQRFSHKNATHTHTHTETHTQRHTHRDTHT